MWHLERRMTDVFFIQVRNGLRNQTLLLPGGLAMAEGASGVFWLLMNVVLVAILGAALVYGVVMWSRRSKSPASQKIRDEGTERVYEESERQERGKLPT